MADLLEYKCPCCGGAINFDSATQKMKCPYCDTEFDPAALMSRDEVLKQPQKDHIHWDTQTQSVWSEDEKAELRSYICRSCGGEIIGDAQTAAASCPYCGNPVVMTGQFSGDLRPDYVIPFKLDKKAAKEKYDAFIQGKKLLPKIFKDQNHIDEIKGVYVPFWLFDADVDANIQYEATRTRVWSDRDYDYTETSYFMVDRAGRIAFDRVPVDGSSKMPDDLMESIEPFDFNDAVDFQTAYLAGYLADKFDVGSEQSVSRANARIKTSAEAAFADTVTGYNAVLPKSGNINVQNGKAKYALYPVWLLNTTWNGKQYTFAMNGQTGKFVGDLPMDKGAYWKWWALYSGVAGAVCAGLTAILYFR
ncbi:MAG: hypothetical protein IJ766_09455 [Clostridia bacterium]|nr:hypothetical protein [Clostridia bacterium]